MLLWAHDIDTLVLLGQATSGVIVSTVRYAADADYAWWSWRMAVPTATLRCTRS
jgi:nicotinamidase-related amidase